jgi:hypothetical protein
MQVHSNPSGGETKNESLFNIDAVPFIDDEESLIYIRST